MAQTMNTIADDAIHTSASGNHAETGQGSAAVRAQLQLRELILSGELPGGMRIAELAIVEKLGMSRTPIRAVPMRLSCAAPWRGCWHGAPQSAALPQRY
jgi:GntR family transcriptional regulator, vanillate catabolism transcriptional regulator